MSQRSRLRYRDDNVFVREQSQRVEKDDQCAVTLSTSEAR